MPTILIAAENIQLARMNPYIAGSVQVAACSTTNDTNLYHPVTQPGTSESDQGYLAIKVTVAVDKTITAYKIRECDSGGSGVGNGVAFIATHNSGADEPNLSGTTPVHYSGSTSQTIATSTMPTCPSNNVDEYALETPYTLPSGTYWEILEIQNSAQIGGFYAASPGDRVCYKGLLGDTWTCTSDYMYDMELWGCN